MMNCTMARTRPQVEKEEQRGEKSEGITRKEGQKGNEKKDDTDQRVGEK